MTESLRLTPTRDVLAECLVWAGAAACLAGIAGTGLWRELAPGRFAESLLLAALATMLAWPLRRWRGWSWASALALPWWLSLMVMTGPVPMLATLLMVAAAMGLGSWLVGSARPVLALPCGLALIAGLLGWLLPLPVHAWWSYTPVLLLVAWLRRAALQRQLAACRTGWRHAVAASPRAAAMGVLLLGIASTGAWLPTMQYDDLAYHLALPWQLMEHGRYALDPSQQVWALAPWAGDVLQAIPQVIARAESRSALNVAWLVLTAAGLWRLCALVGLPAWLRWSAVALFASLPMTTSLQAGMQTETAGAAITVALAVAILDPGDDRARRLLAGALLFGLLCALKPVHALAALPLLGWAAWRARGAWPGAGSAVLALLLVLAVGASSYSYAWQVSGNPVLPLFNSHFRSPAFAAIDFMDTRWHAGFDAALPWALTFDTDRYVEGWDGALGLLPVALAGAWLVALLHRRSRGLAVCATLAALLPLSAMQYARYVHPALVLLLPALLAALQGLPARRASVLVVALCLGNLALQANAGWMLRTGAVKQSVLALGRDEPLFRHYAPERVLAERIRGRADARGPVLLLSQPFHAEFAGRGRDVAWYAPRMEAAARQANKDRSGRRWAAFLRDEGIAEVILDPATLTPAQRAGLSRLGARREAVAGNAEWWRIPPQETPR